MAPKSKATKAQGKVPEPPKQYPTIAAKLEAEYLASRPYQVLKDTKGLSSLTPGEQAAYANYRFLETGVWKTWSNAAQTEFLRIVEQQKIPQPLPKPGPFGKDWKGRDIGTYTPEEYSIYLQSQKDFQKLRRESAWFRERWSSLSNTEREEDSAELENERNRRKFLGQLRRKKMGKYEGDPVWDDVVPIPQDDGEGALAQIAYTEEYAEATGYLRAIMAAKEYSPRVLALTEHIITLNAAHYTVWLYRASTIFALKYSINDELGWVNKVALKYEKNYQIWHHRQILVDHLYPSIAADPDAKQDLAISELAFMTLMFNADSKNYHVWSYRQYLVRKLNLFNESELKSIEALLRSDVRNNSAWSHRFFIVFSNPETTTPGSPATARDPKVSAAIIDRELAFAKAATYEAPQNPSPWNYIRGVLKKGGRDLKSEEPFASEFANIEDGDVKSSHALDFLAEIWSEKKDIEKADKALRLLGDKYDPIRKNYWDWKRSDLKA